MMSECLDWQRVDNYTSRLKVPGGWLVKILEEVTHCIEGGGYYDYNRDYRVSMCFLPDPEHKWLESEMLLYGEFNE